MRFIAAFMVFAFHTMFLQMYPSGVQNVMNKVLWAGGYTGVGFFFVLSGFVLAWSARPSDTTRAFWRRRFFKLYPNHLTTFVAAAILLVTVDGLTFNVRDAFLNVFLVQSWSPNLNVRGNFNGVAWSLSCEALFYLSFPLLMRWINRIRTNRLWFWAGGVVVAIMAVPLLSLTLPTSPWYEFSRVNELQLWFIYQAPLFRVLDFVLGIVLARIVITGGRLPLGRGAAALLAVGAYLLAALVFPGAYALVAIMAGPLGLLIAASAKADVAGRKGWLTSRPVVFLGDVSFAFYMWHSLILYYVYSWLFGPPANLAVALGQIALLLGLVVAVSSLQYLGIERPVMRRFAVSRRGRRRSTVVPIKPGQPEERAA